LHIINKKNGSDDEIKLKAHIEQIKRSILPILQRYDVMRAAIFGSFVRGEMRETSDLDILVEFKGEKSLLDLVGLKIELKELLGRKVDVLTYDSLHPFLKENILSEQEVIL